MKHFVLNHEPDKNTVRLTGKDYHYLVNVRRLAVGECFPALLPSAKCGEVTIRIQSIDGKVLTGLCINADTPCSNSIQPPIKLILFQALPKGDKMDLIVRQAAEGGLEEIVPFVSDFSAARTRKNQKQAVGAQKMERWKRIIREARQQSGSVIATELHDPLNEDKLFEYWENLKKTSPAVLGLFFHHIPLEQESLHGYLKNVPQTVVLVIGPEGGFSDEEASRFLEAGFKPFTIGDTILRTETAALYCAAAIRIILLERDKWDLK